MHVPDSLRFRIRRLHRTCIVSPPARTNSDSTTNKNLRAIAFSFFDFSLG
jgi:hypothetical protein